VDVRHQRPGLAEIRVAQKVSVNGRSIDGVQPGDNEQGLTGPGAAVDLFGRVDGLIVG
jgi:hypothetical protein